MKKLILSQLLVLAAASTAWAGVVYEIEVTDHEQSPPKTDDMQVTAEGKNIAMEIPPSEDGSGGKTIYRGDRREMVVVNDAEQSYFVIDKAVVAGIADQVSDTMKQMEEMYKNLPKEQQDAIKAARASGMEGMPGPAAIPRMEKEIKNTGERGNQRGYPCVKYEVLSDGRKIREIWITDWDNVEGGSEVVGVFEDMTDFFAELKESFPQMAEGQGPDMDFTETFANGFPVVTREFDPESGDLESETGLRSAKRQTIDPDAFEPPSGYKRAEMFRQ